ncbi:MAG: acetyl-CoA carboxylase carboxyltransferase component, partial [Candidatus Paceibacteria bacterium]
WPGATVAVMGAAGATKIIHRRDIAGASDPVKAEAEYTKDYEERFNNPYMAAARGFVDDVIEAHDTRPHLIRALELFKTKHEDKPVRKHGNIPL